MVRQRRSNGDGDAPPTPAQASVSERRVLRSRYKEFMSCVAGQRDAICRIDEGRFNSLVSSVDDLYSKVHRPRELIADAEAVLDISSQLLRYAKNLQRKSGPSPSDFVAALLENYKDEQQQFSWSLLGSDSPLRPFQGFGTMIVVAGEAPKKRKLAPRTRTKLAAPTRPEEIEGEQAGESKCGETSKNMETMFELLRKQKRARLDSLILNRSSFAQTVENLFALSFLVKDGRAEMISADKAIFVVLRNAPSGSDRANGNVKNTQFVFRLDYKDWQFMKECVEEGRELMPDRSNPQLTPIRVTCRNRAKATTMETQSPCKRPRL